MKKNLCIFSRGGNIKLTKISDRMRYFWDCRRSFDFVRESDFARKSYSYLHISVKIGNEYAIQSNLK